MSVFGLGWDREVLFSLSRCVRRLNLANYSVARSRSESIWMIVALCESASCATNSLRAVSGIQVMRALRLLGLGFEIVVFSDS